MLLSTALIHKIARVE